MNGRERQRDERLMRLLHDLVAHGEDFRGAYEIGASSGLGDAVLPLLADLARRGWAEHTWHRAAFGVRLCYRLTGRGRDEAARALGGRGEASG